MPKKFHDKIRSDLKKAHPGWGKDKLEAMTNATMAFIAKRSAKRKSGSWAGPKGKRK